MASTRQELREEVRDLLSRNTEDLPNSSLDPMIDRASQRIETDFASDYLPTPRQMLFSVNTIIFDEDGAPLPTDLLRVKSVKIGERERRYVPLSHIGAQTQDLTTQIKVVYYQRLFRMPFDDDTNWVLEYSDRLYVYGTAIEYTMWNKEAQSDKATYVEAYTDALNQTAVANQAAPVSGFGRAKTVWNGFYSITADNKLVIS